MRLTVHEEAAPACFNEHRIRRNPAALSIGETFFGRASRKRRDGISNAVLHSIRARTRLNLSTPCQWAFREFKTTNNWRGVDVAVVEATPWQLSNNLEKGQDIRFASKQVKQADMIGGVLPRHR
eukprot:5915293-Amphidinium_carterae.1